MHVNKLHYWVQKVLPLVYDDSLSYYELLLKVVHKLNEVIDTTNNFSSNIYDDVRQILDAWKVDGTFDIIINSVVNFLNGKSVVILGDSNAELFQNREPLGNGKNWFELMGATCQRLAVGGSRCADVGQLWVGKQLENIPYDPNHKDPDYILFWCGGNDISARNNFGGFNANVYKNLNTLNRGKAFEGTEYVLRYIREVYPTSKIIGLIRNKPTGLNDFVFRYFFYIQNQIFQKYNVPVVDVTKCFNSTSQIGVSNQVYMQSDGRHLTPLGCDRVAELVLGAMRGGLNCHTDFECHHFYYDDDTISASSDEAAYWVMNNIKPKAPYSLSGNVYALNASLGTNYTYAEWSGDGNDCFGLRLRLFSPMDIHALNTQHENEEYRVYVINADLHDADLHNLDNGRYIVIGGKGGTIAHNPISDASVGFIVDVTHVLATGFRYYNVQTFDNRFFVGHKFANETSISWNQLS